MNRLLLSAVALLSVVTSGIASGEEPSHCGGYVKIAYTKLPDSVFEQRKVTAKVPVEKAMMGDIIFFKGSRWGCPDGVSGLVTNVGKGFLVFVIGVAEPKEQVLLFPTESYKGNGWFHFFQDIRTFQPETDPPRP